jgi:hypothetical protein
MTTATELAREIGQRMSYVPPSTPTMIIYGTVQDARLRFGQVDVLFVPDAGAGSAWLARTSVTVIEEN